MKRHIKTEPVLFVRVRGLDGEDPLTIQADLDDAVIETDLERLPLNHEIEQRTLLVHILLDEANPILATKKALAFAHCLLARQQPAARIFHDDSNRLPQSV